MQFNRYFDPCLHWLQIKPYLALRFDDTKKSTAIAHFVVDNVFDIFAVTMTWLKTTTKSLLAKTNQLQPTPRPSMALARWWGMLSCIGLPSGTLVSDCYLKKTSRSSLPASSHVGLALRHLLSFINRPGVSRAHRPPILLLIWGFYHRIVGDIDTLVLARSDKTPHRR